MVSLGPGKYGKTFSVSITIPSNDATDSYKRLRWKSKRPSCGIAPNALRKQRSLDNATAKKRAEAYLKLTPEQKVEWDRESAELDELIAEVRLGEESVNSDPASGENAEADRLLDELHA